MNYDACARRFNFRGAGGSGGSFGGGTLETLDVYGAITELQKHKAFNGIGIVGYSFGGGVGLRTAMAHPAVQARDLLAIFRQGNDECAASNANRSL